VASFAYPDLLSPLEHARSTLPPVLRTSPFFEWAQVLVAPFARVAAELAEYVSGLAYPRLATGDALAALASWVDEPRGGMDETEWRRLVLGAISARNSRANWTDDSARALVAEITQSPSVVVDTSAAGWVRWRARLTWRPTQEWLTRASATVAKGVPGGLMFQAILVPDGAFRWNQEPGWNVGLWCATLSRGVV